jgi:catechol 2,3-dioxygenase-like lactoylglutathione lyase family enzyme
VAAPRLDHLVVGVADPKRANEFYERVVGVDPVELPRGRVAYRLANAQLNVHGPDSTAQPLARHPVGPGNSDLCFVWDGRIEDAVRHLESNQIEVIEGPVERQGANGTGSSVYFRDPDGSLLEFISYEVD